MLVKKYIYDLCPLIECSKEIKLLDEVCCFNSVVLCASPLASALEFRRHGVNAHSFL
jgi:hypothetical protein